MPEGEIPPHFHTSYPSKLGLVQVSYRMLRHLLAI